MHRRFSAMFLLPLLACGGAPSSGAAEPTARGFTFEAAIGDARAAHPGGIPFEVELETEDGRQAIEVELIVGDAVIERYYDPATGTLLEEGTETLDAEETAALPRLRDTLRDGSITLEGALAMALEVYPREAIREVELEMHRIDLVLEVGVEEDGAVTTWVHDPRTGERLGREAEDEREAQEGHE